MAVSVLKGLLPDGKQGADFNPRRTLRLTKQQALTVQLEVVDGAGVPVELGDLSNLALTLTVKNNSEDAGHRIQVAGSLVPAEGPHRADFSIAAADTEHLNAGRYVYDVWLSHDGGQDPVVPLSPFVVGPASGP